MRRTLIIAVVIAALALAGCGTKGAVNPLLAEMDAFAQCLTDKGVKMYGAYWCPHCQNQKEMFGDSWEKVDYVECSLPEKAGQTQFCKDEGIKGYPTWEFSDGPRIEGEVTFQQLSERTGCSLGGSGNNG